MSKWIQSLLLCLLALGSFNACIMDIDKELPDCPSGGEIPLAVTASLYCNGREIAWPDSSLIGVALLQAATDEFVYTPAVKPYFLSDPLRKWFEPLAGTAPAGRPAAGSSRNAIGIYPVSLTLGKGPSASLSVADQSDPATLDFLMARRVSDITQLTDTIHFDFYRQMCRLVFRLSLTRVDADGVRTDAPEELAGARVKIGGLPVTGTFSWDDFLLSVSEPAPFQALMRADGLSGQAIVYPREPGEGVTFTVSLPQHPDTVYTFGMDALLALAACKAYTFDLPMEYRVNGESPAPGAKHTIRYRFEGGANSDNVTVYKEDLSTRWPLGETIQVDDHGCFSFGYESGLAVTIRTDDGKTISLSPGQLYHFSDITADLTIIISAVAGPPAHRVNYLFEGEANASNVKVYKESLYTPWPQGEYVTVADGGDFSFGYLSSLDITVRTADGHLYTVLPDQLFTLADIHSDITLIISGKTETPDIRYHRITYEYQGELNAQLAPVQGTADVAYPDWEPNATIFVADGRDFTFRYDLPAGYTPDVTVTLDGKVMADIVAGADRVFHNITHDMHFILYDKKYHTVTVVTNLADQATTETHTLVVSEDRFETTLPPGSDLVVKVDGKTVTPTDGRYVIEHVTKDTVIVITNDKGDAKPDLIIKADVHDWEELPVVDGGVITPDKK